MRCGPRLRKSRRTKTHHECLNCARTCGRCANHSTASITPQECLRRMLEKTCVGKAQRMVEVGGNGGCDGAADRAEAAGGDGWATRRLQVWAGGHYTHGV